MNDQIKVALINGKFSIINTVINSIFFLIAAILGIFSFNINQSNKILKTENTELSEQNNDWASEYNSLQKQLNNLNDTNISLTEELSSLKNTLDEYSLLLNKSNSSNKSNSITTETTLEESSSTDLLEIDGATEIIYNYTESFSDYFENIKIDSNEIELFYKMFLCGSYYKYSNIIKALELYGINCRELSINEYLLASWDIEILYSYYKMEESVENRLNENNENKIFYFNDFKMNNIDTFEYGSWSMNYQDDSFEFIDTDLNKRINDINLKMKMNFRS